MTLLTTTFGAKEINDTKCEVLELPGQVLIPLTWPNLRVDPHIIMGQHQDVRLHPEGKVISLLTALDEADVGVVSVIIPALGVQKPSLKQGWVG